VGDLRNHQFHASSMVKRPLDHSRLKDQRLGRGRYPRLERSRNVCSHIVEH
jgi:hypothetical protein